MLAAHHASRKSLGWLLQKGSGNPSIDWLESVDEALCFGGFDGILARASMKELQDSFHAAQAKQRLERGEYRNVDKLVRENRMQPAGLKAFAAAKRHQSGILHTNKGPDWSNPIWECSNEKVAWKFFQNHRPVIANDELGVVSAKQEATRPSGSTNDRRVGAGSTHEISAVIFFTPLGVNVYRTCDSSQILLSSARSAMWNRSAYSAPKELFDFETWVL